MKQSGTQAEALHKRAQAIYDGLRRRARKAGVALDCDTPVIRELLVAHRQCFYCRGLLSFDVTVDHKLPLDRGGSHGFANLAVCCTRCNTLKGLMDGEEFEEFLALLQRLDPRARNDLTSRLLAGGRVYDGRPPQKRARPV